MRTWPRNLAIGAGVGLAVGLVVGGTVGRIFMRILFLTEEGNSGFETAMGAIIGDFTGGGTAFIYIFGAIAGVVLGLAYTAAPVPLLVERLAPDRERTPGPLARAVVVLGMTGFALLAVSGVMMAYSQPRFF